MSGSALPAMLGGQPALAGPLPAWPPQDPAQEEAILQVLRTDQWWSKGGSAVTRFEESFARAHGTRFAIACTNGTHALELAFRALGIGAGDEVIVPAMTFVATGMAAMLVGARPVPVDIDPHDWCISPDAIRAALTPATKAVVPVHFAGHVADMDAIMALADEAGIAVVEDAAHAHGAARNGRSAGSCGAFSAYSFQNFKLMTAGEGGMLLANDEALARRARLVSHCGRPDGDRTYAHLVLGSNMRMTEFQGALLQCQLDRLEERAALREARARRLRAGLASLNGVRVQTVAADVERHSWYMAVMAIDEAAFGRVPRQRIVDALVAEGVPAYRMYPRIQDVPHFAGDFARLGGDLTRLPESPVSADLAANGIWLHHRLLLGEEALIDQTVEAFARILRHGEQLRDPAAG